MNSFSKVLQVVFMVVLLPIQLIGQERQWHEFELDKIKINFPTKEVFQLDTVIAGVELKQLYARFENSTLIIQKISANDALGNKDLSSLPYDHKSLIEYYNGIVDGANDSYKAEEIKREEIKLGVLIGYRATYYDGTGTPFVESNIFLAGEELISISFHNLQPEIYQIKEAFLSSLKKELFIK